jgi:chlorobactene glucosyltransferase
MSPSVIVLFLLWGSIIAVWQGLLIAQFLIRRRGLLLKPGNIDGADRSQDAAVRPEVCVIIPARNEGSELAECLDNVLGQDYPRLCVLVVNDRSEDDTASIALRYARADPRVRIVNITSLPDGWLGKSNALWQGTRQLTEDWLLFLDADCRLEPSGVSTAVAEAQARHVELLSLWPRQAAGTFWEHMTIPLCAGIIALWFGSDRVNRPQHQAAFANGQFLLIKRSAYERIDGHRAVRSALIEDVPLAELAKRAGVACRVASGRELVSVRMYRNYSAIRDGWARIYVGALRSSLKLAISILWLVFGSLLPYAVAAALLVERFVLPASAGGRSPETLRVMLAGLCASHLILMYIVSYRFWGLGDCPRSYLWLYPVSVCVVIDILLRALWWLGVRRSVDWRGRRYSIDRHAVIALPARPSGTHIA